MIGNDLVAFEACREYTPQRWQAYWGKILHQTEWEHFPSLDNDPRTWVYWAAKEAAWKVWFRRSARRLLNPKAFVIEKLLWHGNRASFEVRGPDENYTGFADWSDAYLHAVVQPKTTGLLNKSHSVLSSFQVCPRDRLLECLNADTFLSTYSPLNPQISLSRNNLGIPSLEIGGNVLDLPISLSHHGPWAAYAYVYP